MDSRGRGGKLRCCIFLSPYFLHRDDRIRIDDLALLGTVAFAVFRKRTLSVWAFPSLVIVLDHFWPRVFPWTMAHVLVGSKTLTQMVDLGGTLG